jgi:hypothetical protein
MEHILITPEHLLEYGFIQYANLPIYTLPMLLDSHSLKWVNASLKRCSYNSGLTLVCRDHKYNDHLPHIRYMHQLLDLYRLLNGVELKQVNHHKIAQHG